MVGSVGTRVRMWFHLVEGILVIMERIRTKQKGECGGSGQDVLFGPLVGDVGYHQQASVR